MHTFTGWSHLRVESIQTFIDSPSSYKDDIGIYNVPIEYAERIATKLLPHRLSAFHVSGCFETQFVKGVAPLFMQIANGHISPHLSYCNIGSDTVLNLSPQGEEQINRYARLIVLLIALRDRKITDILRRLALYL